MTNYDFLILSPNEFECLSRDLLQKKLSVFIESFTTGKDGGIDLRYASIKGEIAIIQAKRYESYSSLLSNLKKEAEKVKRLQPQKYILTTSVGLTPNNKDEIKALFSPYISSTENVFGKDDLNNLLGQHEDIERKYYKLWLASTNVLQKILHSKIYNQTSFFQDDIIDTVKVFVQNDSFYKALDILEKNKYVVISGIPGIGKTTLSKMLVFHMLSQGFEEPVYIQDSIDDGWAYYEEEKSQIFFFDDFLGSNSFEAKNKQNGDNKIISFIEKIKKSPNKYLIIATREYILKQAMGYYERFNTHNIEIAKCILDLSSYTKLIRAQILYNHLAFQNIPQEHLANFIENENYLTLILHKNYNPRIIEAIINHQIWKNCEAKNFTEKIKVYFDNPQSVWKYAFENSLDRFSQFTLLVLLTLGTPVLIDDLEIALKEFLKINSYKFIESFDSIKFKRALRELEDTFIKTQKDKHSNHIIEYQNPSIQDFLVNYLNDKSDLIEDLLNSIVFTNQFFKVFTTRKDIKTPILQKIKLTTKQTNIAINRILSNYNTFNTSKVHKFVYSSDNFYWGRSTSFKYTFLNDIRIEFIHLNSRLENFFYEKVQKLIDMDDEYLSEKDEFIDIISNINFLKLNYDETSILSRFCEHSHYINDIEAIESFKNIFPNSYNDFISSEAFLSKIVNIVDEEVRNVDDIDISELIEEIKSIENNFGLSFSGKKTELQERNDKYESYVDSLYEKKVEKHDPYEEKQYQESERIKEIFTSLLENH